MFIQLQIWRRARSALLLLVNVLLTTGVVLWLNQTGFVAAQPAAAPAAQAGGNVVTVNGQLLENGFPVADGSYPLTFTIYDSGGAAIWSEAQTVSISGGYGQYTASLGASNPLSPGMFASTTTLGMTYNGTELQAAMGAAPSALLANDAQNLGGTAAASYTLDSEVMTIVLANDGSGSGLDADTIDGIDSSAIGGVPSGMIGFFGGSCPTGWTDLSATYGGRALVFTPSGGTSTATVGAALGDQGTRTITDVPAHTHSASGGGTVTTSTDGNHTHAFRYWNNPNGCDNIGWPCSTHAKRIGYQSYWIGGGSENVGSGETYAGAHSHTVDLSSFSIGSTGVAAVDVSMPYVQLTACQSP